MSGKIITPLRMIRLMSGCVMGGGTMNYEIVGGSLIFFVLFLASGLCPLSGQNPPESVPVIQVSGAGEVTVVPDVLELNIGVRSEASASAEALAQNSRKMNRLIEEMKKAGIPDKDIRTRSVRLHPSYKTKEGRREVTGYTAVNMVLVKIRDLEKSGSVIDEAVQAGGNMIEGVQFSIDNPDPYADQARELAFQDARRKAEQLASLAGMELDTVISLSESSQMPSPVSPRIMTEARGLSAVPVEPGEQAVRVNVQVSWSMSKKK